MPNKIVLRRLYALIRPYTSLFAIAMIAALAVAGLSALQAYMVKPLLDKIFVEKSSYFLAILPLALILLFAVKAFFYGLNFYLLEKIGQTVIRNMRNKVFEHIHLQSLSFFHRTPTGELISRVISDINFMQAAISTVVVGLLRDFLQAVFLLIVIFTMDWKLALLSLVFLPSAAIPIVKFGRAFRRISTTMQEQIADVSNTMHESITGAPVVKAFTMEKYESSRFSVQVNMLFNTMMEKAKYRCIQHPLMEVIGGIGMALIIWFGGKEVIAGNSTPGTFFAFLTALVMIYEPIKAVSKINATIQQGLAAAVRIFQLLDQKPDILSKENAAELTPFQKEITLRDVHFSYDGISPILKDINLSVPAGEILAIVGPSGSGKSTLTSLIPRFFDIENGSLLIDGVNIKDVTLESLRRQIAIVTQQTILFNDTIRANIAYGDQDKSNEDIERAADAAHALNFIQELPEGFDTVIGESGIRLSGGERQRLSIARAILKNAPILILDEATSALDTESERLVQKALENLMKDRTTLVIAHRLSTIKNADRIIVIKDGMIVEEGTHDTLLSQNGEYETLYNMQYQN
ncbi:ABC-type multidrug transport system, ATPase and permease component [Desulfocapsa sulfexigens DSM 10523]|uniref:ABC-type multidrug transport system, ATPase and permease component n=2 Tax=Desulfocapsa TaxID=53318 RepID=M1PRB3_DESSD|nr:ABC-type multidrug transport system, ATPase and permease component [Desulfocapsa sulfexigens DSM 10523]